MTTRSVARRLSVLAAAVLLASLAGCLAHVQAPDPVVCHKFVAPPIVQPQEPPITERGGFAARPASLLKKTGFTADEVPFLRRFRAAVGVKPEEVEAFVTVEFVKGAESAGRVLLVRTKGDVSQGNVMMACQAGNPTKLACGAKAYTGESGLAVHFPQAKVAMITDGVETMGRCLPQMTALAARLDEAGHDVSAWESTSGDGLPFLGMKDLGLGRGPRPAVWSQMRMARLWFDVAPTFDARLELDYADEESAKLGGELLSGAGELGAGWLALGRGYARILKTQPARSRIPKPQPTCSQDETEADVRDLPLDLLGRAEEGLRKCRVAVKGKTASLTFWVPLKHEDGPACRKLFAHVWVQEDEEVGPGLVFGAYLTRPPSACEAQEAGALIPPPPDPPATPQPPPQTLTVANVRKEAVVLFTVDDKGELTFAAKVPHGEAIDLNTQQGQRLVATFLSEPYRETFTVGGDKATWLIRATPPPIEQNRPVEAMRSLKPVR